MHNPWCQLFWFSTGKSSWVHSRTQGLFPLVADDLLYQVLSPPGRWRRLDHGHDLCSLIWMLLRVVISEPVFVFELGCVSQTICFRVLYNTCFVIMITLRWCNLIANHLWNVVTYDMLCWITVILVVCKLVWNPSRFQLTTGFIWAQVREFDRFGDCFCTCALINWSVLWQILGYPKRRS